MKNAAFYIDKNFDKLNNKYKQNSKPGKIVGLIHDEAISYIPGQAKIIDLVEKNGSVIPTFKFPDISYEYAKAQEDGMKKAMDELLHVLIPGFPAKADCALGTSWASK